MTPIAIALKDVTGASNKGYEFKAVALMALGLGIVGFDRFIINPLFIPCFRSFRKTWV